MGRTAPLILGLVMAAASGCGGTLLLDPDGIVDDGGGDRPCSPDNLGGTCGDGETCIAGACAGPCSVAYPDGVCDAGSWCFEGICVPLRCSASHPDGTCDPGFGCDGGVCISLGACSYGNPDGECGPGEICVIGSCDPQPDCSSTDPDGICPDGEFCADGECTAYPPCSETFPAGICDPGYACVDAVCDPIPCTPESPHGLCDDLEEYCSEEGFCEPYPCDPDHPNGICPPERICDEGFCRLYPCSPDHPSGFCEDPTQICIFPFGDPDFGTCQFPCVPGTLNGWCSVYEECVLGECQLLCQSGVRCGPTMTCCGDNQECLGSDCADICYGADHRCGLVCCDDAEVCFDDHLCFLDQGGCTNHEDCLNDSFCDCPAGVPCAPLGACIPYGTDPTDPEINEDCSNLVVVGVFAPEHQCSFDAPTDEVEHCPNDVCGHPTKTCVDDPVTCASSIYCGYGDGAANCLGCKLCIGCVTDPDCDAGEVCDSGICRPSCANGAECDSHETCSGDACYECLDEVNDSDCYGGLSCVNGYCVDIFGGHTHVLTTPSVIDFDFDNDPTTYHPSIVFVGTHRNGGSLDDCYDGGVIRVLDGRDCTTQFVVNRRKDDLYDAAAHNAPVGRAGTMPDARGCNPVALADLDGTSPQHSEIIAHAATSGAVPGGLVAFTYDETARGGRGAFRVAWHSTRADGTTWDQYCGSSCAWWTGPSVYDLEADGVPEVFMAGHTYDAAGVYLDSAPGYASGNCCAYSQGMFPIVADVDSDGVAEFVDGYGIYDWTGSAWSDTNDQATNRFFGHVALADFGSFDGAAPINDDRGTLDGIAEVAKVASGRVYLQDLSGRHLLIDDTAANGIYIGAGTGGPPTVADFDGDCRAEIAVACRDYYTVYDPDCDGGVPDVVDCNGVEGVSTCAVDSTLRGVLWRLTSQDNSSSVTGSSVFDFEGDGRAEAIYADECFTRVYDGVTGEVIYSQYRSSCTWYENPIVADVDGDFNAEVVVGSNTNCGIGCNGSTVDSGDGRRVDARFAGLRCDSDADCVAGAGACACKYGLDVDGTCLVGGDPNEVTLGLCTCTSDTDCGSTTSYFICSNRPTDAAYAYLDAFPSNRVCRAYHPGNFNGILVYRDVLDRWVDTRRIWNQHAYSITHINEDGTAMAATTQNWTGTGLNNFRQNVLGDLDPEHSPDLTSGSGSNTCISGESDFGRIAVSVCNRGTADVAAVPVAFYEGDPATGGEPLCILTTGEPMAPGECVPLVCLWPGSTTVGDPECPLNAAVYVVADDDGSGGLGERECLEGNNTAILP